jgi:hypothetical protein
MSGLLGALCTRCGSRPTAPHGMWWRALALDARHADALDDVALENDEEDDHRE